MDSYIVLDSKIGQISYFVYATKMKPNNLQQAVSAGAHMHAIKINIRCHHKKRQNENNYGYHVFIDVRLNKPAPNQTKPSEIE